MNKFLIKNVNIIQKKKKCPWKCERLIQIDSFGIRKIYCNQCYKNIHIDCDGQTKQKINDYIKRSSTFNNQSERKIHYFCKTAVNLFI